MFLGYAGRQCDAMAMRLGQITALSPNVIYDSKITTTYIEVICTNRHEMYAIYFSDKEENTH